MIWTSSRMRQEMARERVSAKVEKDPLLGEATLEQLSRVFEGQGYYEGMTYPQVSRLRRYACEENLVLPI